jgi:hypothetical protein
VGIGGRPLHAPVLWQNAVVLERLTARKEWKFFAVLPKADPGLAAAWWASLLLRGILLDAETEHALFEHYAAAARGTSDSGRLTILASHRFSTVRMADLIVVLDGARLVEVGTHDELMAASGQYSELYTIQAAAYR